MNIVNLDIKPENIFVGNRMLGGIDQIIYMDLGASIVLDNDREHAKYVTAIATPEYCSTKFYKACGF